MVTRDKEGERGRMVEVHSVGRFATSCCLLDARREESTERKVGPWFYFAHGGDTPSNLPIYNN